MFLRFFLSLLLTATRGHNGKDDIIRNVLQSTVEKHPMLYLREQPVAITYIGSLHWSKSGLKDTSEQRSYLKIQLSCLGNAGIWVTPFPFYFVSLSILVSYTFFYLNRVFFPLSTLQEEAQVLLLSWNINCGLPVIFKPVL